MSNWNTAELLLSTAYNRLKSFPGCSCDCFELLKFQVSRSILKPKVH